MNGMHPFYIAPLGVSSWLRRCLSSCAVKYDGVTLQLSSPPLLLGVLCQLLLISLLFLRDFFFFSFFFNASSFMCNKRWGSWRRAAPMSYFLLILDCYVGFNLGLSPQKKRRKKSDLKLCNKAFVVANSDFLHVKSLTVSLFLIHSTDASGFLWISGILFCLWGFRQTGAGCIIIHFSPSVLSLIIGNRRVCVFLQLREGTVICGLWDVG